MAAYVILDVLSGAMDGVYADKRLAQDAFKGMQEEWPQLHWVLLKVEESAIPDGQPLVPDCAWHMDLLNEDMVARAIALSAQPMN